MGFSLSSLRAAAAGTLLCLSALPASALDLSINDGPSVVFGAGAYEIVRNEASAVFRGEYRFGDKYFFLQPFVGLEGTSGHNIYGYGGFGVEIGLTDHLILYPNVAVGLYGKGDDKELGSVIEFRSGFELDYRFSDKSRLGFSFHHLSNAGITMRNPGVEEALLTYTLPLSLFSK